MQEKIKEARNYVKHTMVWNEKNCESYPYDYIVNDAANIFSESYEEYCEIYDALIKEGKCKT